MAIICHIIYSYALRNTYFYTVNACTLCESTFHQNEKAWAAAIVLGFIKGSREKLQASFHNQAPSIFPQTLTESLTGVKICEKAII